MKILAFDTSGPRLSLAVYDGRKKLAAFESADAGRHSESLLPELERLIKSARVAVKKIDCVAVGVGPGSFTGLRIGVTAAKTLAYATGAKLVGVSSLEAAARSIGKEGDVAVCSDARKSQVYGAVYRRRAGRWIVVQKPAIHGRDEFLASVSGMTLLEDALPGADGLAEAALERAAKKKFDDPVKLSPLYLHPKDCNVQKK